VKEKPAAPPKVDATMLKSNEIARTVLATGIRPTGFRVEFLNGVAHLRGSVMTEDERQRVLSATRSVGGVREIRDELQVGGAAGQTAPLGGGKTYTVKKGDTLSEIAQQHYGKASDFKKIFEANRDVLSDPDKIKPGQVLKLP
jgi:nucleoid-associated protein YgaU